MPRPILLVVAVLLTIVLPGCNNGGGDDGTFVYVMSNKASGNEIIAFRLREDALEFHSLYPTGGTGTGTTEVSPATPQDGIDPLASQGSLRISRDRHFLF